MERLTYKIHDGGIFVKKSDVKTFYVEDEIMHTGNAIRKLAEYEDLEEQCIKETSWDLTTLLRKWKEFFPCIVGDTVYFISEKTEKQGRRKDVIEFVDKGIVDNITLGSTMVPQIAVCNDENIWITFDSVDDFGKTVFLAQAEADEALERMEGEKQ